MKIVERYERMASEYRGGHHNTIPLQREVTLSLIEAGIMALADLSDVADGVHDLRAAIQERIDNLRRAVQLIKEDGR